MMSTAARNAASIPKCVVSSKCASGAALRGRPCAGNPVRPAATDRPRSFSSAGSPRLRISAVRRRAHLRRRHHKNLHVRARRNDRADIAAVEHRAGRLRGKAALVIHERLPHLRDRRHHRGGFGDRRRLQCLFRNRVGSSAIAASIALSTLSGASPASARPGPPPDRSGRCRDEAAHRSPPPAGDRALARGCRAVYVSDDHRHIRFLRSVLTGGPRPRTDRSNGRTSNGGTRDFASAKSFMCIRSGFMHIETAYARDRVTKFASQMIASQMIARQMPELPDPSPIQIDSVISPAQNPNMMPTWEAC